jgi:hypothetical protein
MAEAFVFCLQCQQRAQQHWSYEQLSLARRAMLVNIFLFLSTCTVRYKRLQTMAAAGEMGRIVNVYSETLCYIVFLYAANFLIIARLEISTAMKNQVLVCYHTTTRCRNREDYDLNFLLLLLKFFSYFVRKFPVG